MVPAVVTPIEHPLRRTLQRLVRYSAFYTKVIYKLVQQTGIMPIELENRI